MHPEIVFGFAISISSNFFTTDAKLTSVHESFENKISIVLENAISRAIEKVAKMEPNSVVPYWSPIKVKQSNDNIHRYRVNSLKLIVTIVPKSGDSTNGPIANDFREMDGILNEIRL